MVAITQTPRLIRPPAPDFAVATLGAAAAAALVALVCLVMPSGLLEALVVRSGFAALVNAAAPPLGFTARLLLAAGSGILAGAMGWAVLVLVAGERRIRVKRPAWRLPTLPAIVRLPRIPGRSAPAGQGIRRADSHPDAPPRPPILAERELGLPFLSVVAPVVGSAMPPVPEPIADERALPDLDTTLAVADPAAMPDVPRELVPAVASLIVPPLIHRPVPLAPGERIDSVELGVEVRDRPDSIEALLSRLERGTRRRPVAAAGPMSVEDPATLAVPTALASTPPASSGSLEETLGYLRRLATRG